MNSDYYLLFVDEFVLIIIIIRVCQINNVWGHNACTSSWLYLLIMINNYSSVLLIPLTPAAVSRESNKSCLKNGAKRRVAPVLRLFVISINNC